MREEIFGIERKDIDRNLEEIDEWEGKKVERIEEMEGKMRD